MALQRPLFGLVRLYQSNGSIVCRYYAAPNGHFGVIWLGGVSGGFDSPALDLFDHEAVTLMRRGVSSLRIRYRFPTDLDLCVEDALVALEFFDQQSVGKVVLVGHSFGGAVAIQAGAASPSVVGVATLACQSFGTAAADRISPRPVLLVHGADDTVLPADCSRYIYDRALDPKQLAILDGAGHCFDEVVPDLTKLLEGWLEEVLQLEAR